MRLVAKAAGRRRRPDPPKHSCPIAWALVDQYVARGIDYCREHGLEAWLRYMICARAESDLMQGRWGAAADGAAEILAYPANQVAGPRYWALWMLALVRARRGDPGCWPLLDEALQGARAIGELQYVAAVAIARAEAAWLQGRSDAIAAETDAAFELARELGEPRSLGELACWRWRAGLLTELPSDAEELYRLQIMGQWERVAQLWSDTGQPYEAALALADSGHPSALRQAHNELRALGARPALAIVSRRLRALGERRLPRGPIRSTRDNPGGLTPRELQVLPLLADGLRNAEIAERLYVSQKTVDHHVSAILAKLNARTRSEAVAHARRLGIISQHQGAISNADRSGTTTAAILAHQEPGLPEAKGPVP